MTKKHLRTAIWITSIISIFIILYFPTSKAGNNIVFNEICVNNFSACSDLAGNYNSWIELYNNDEKEHSLKGYKISRGKRGEKFVLDDITLDSHEYTVIFFNDKNWNQYDIDEEGIYTGFSVRSGEAICLTNNKNQILDEIEIPEMDVNIAYARKTDGGGEWQFQLPTPAQTNNGQEEQAAKKEIINIDKPVLSRESGFYEEPFILDMQIRGEGDIYYTLDGSIPTRASDLYEKEILIEDASRNQNEYSMRTDIAAKGQSIFGDVTVPDGLIDKATVVRAVAYDKQGNPSEVVTAVYFIEFAEKEVYKGCSVVSLVSEPENLFGYEKGIYVAGKVCDGVQLTDDWLWQKANYRNSGKSAERDVHIDWFDDNGQLVMTKEAGIRIRGKATRAYPQKSFNLYARKEYDGSDDFSYDFFDDEYALSEISLATGGNDVYTKLKDYLASSFADGLAFASLKYKPCVVFVNGEYWGLYYVTEKYNAQYINKHYGLPMENVVMIRNWQVEEGTEEDLKQLHEDMNYIGSLDMAEEKNYERVCHIVDIDSLIDYYAFSVYINRYDDWLGNPEAGGNWGVWKCRKTASNPYADGKWRWIFFDANSATMKYADINTLEIIEERSYYQVFPNLMKNETFRRKFADRLEYLRENVFDQEKVLKWIKQASDKNRGQVVQTYARFYNGYLDEATYERDIKELMTFYEERYFYIGEIVSELKSDKKGNESS